MSSNVISCMPSAVTRYERELHEERIRRGPGPPRAAATSISQTWSPPRSAASPPTTPAPSRRGCAQERQVRDAGRGQRAGGQQMPRHEDRAEAPSSSGASQEPDGERQQPARRSARRAGVRLPIGVGARRRSTARRRPPGTARARRRARPSVRAAAPAGVDREQRRGAGSVQPRDPVEDVGAPAVEVEEEQQAGDDRRGAGRQVRRRRHRRKRRSEGAVERTAVEARDRQRPSSHQRQRPTLTASSDLHVVGAPAPRRVNTSGRASGRRRRR